MLLPEYQCSSLGFHRQEKLAYDFEHEHNAAKAAAMRVKQQRSSSNLQEAAMKEKERLSRWYNDRIFSHGCPRKL